MIDQMPYIIINLHGLPQRDGGASIYTCIKYHLYNSYDSQIDEAIDFFNAKLNYLRSPGRISRTARGSIKDIVAWKKTVLGETNLDAVLGALTFCQNAIQGLEKMKLSPALDLQKIEKMQAGIPNIDEYQKFTGEKPMER